MGTGFSSGRKALQKIGEELSRKRKPGRAQVCGEVDAVFVRQAVHDPGIQFKRGPSFRTVKREHVRREPEPFSHGGKRRGFAGHAVAVHDARRKGAHVDRQEKPSPAPRKGAHCHAGSAVAVNRARAEENRVLFQRLSGWIGRRKHQERGDCCGNCTVYSCHGKLTLRVWPNPSHGCGIPAGNRKKVDSCKHDNVTCCRSTPPETSVHQPRPSARNRILSISSRRKMP